MEAGLELGRLMSTGCGCCLTPDEQGGSYTCEDRSKVFTYREQDVLARIRSASERARFLRREIEQMRMRREDRAALERALEELAALRRERVELEAERVAAAEERMRWLGHA